MMTTFRRTEERHVSAGFLRLRLRWLGLGGVLVAIGLAYWFSPGFRALVNEVTSPMVKGDLRALEGLIRSFGWWAPAVSFLLMILQTLIAPLPAFALGMANTMVFGMVYGFLLTLFSAFVAALTGFYLTRWFGRPFLERTIGSRPLSKLDSLIGDYGAWAVLVLRLFPVVSFDIISFAAGLTAMRAGPFGLATLVGMLPATIAFSLLGDSIHSANKWSFIGGAILLGLLLIAAGCLRRSAAWRSARRDPGAPAQDARISNRSSKVTV